MAASRELHLTMLIADNGCIWSICRILGQVLVALSHMHTEQKVQHHSLPVKCSAQMGLLHSKFLCYSMTSFAGTYVLQLQLSWRVGADSMGLDPALALLWPFRVESSW